MAIYHGQNVRIDYGDLEFSNELFEAVVNLDEDCKNGCGGTWELFEDDGEWRAIFLDMATDELVWDADEGVWTEGYDEDEDEDEDEEEDEEEEVSD